MAINPHDPPADHPQAGNGEANPWAEPPQVYRAAHNPDHWVVKSPGTTTSATEKIVFKGAQAQHRALIHAYEKFGSARFFPY